MDNRRMLQRMLATVFTLGLILWSPRTPVAIAAPEVQIDVDWGRVGAAINDLAATNPELAGVAQEQLDSVRGELEDPSVSQEDKDALVGELNDQAAEILGEPGNPEGNPEGGTPAESGPSGETETTGSELSTAGESAAVEQPESVAIDNPAADANSDQQATVTQDQCATDPDNFHHDPDTDLCVANTP